MQRKSLKVIVLAMINLVLFATCRDNKLTEALNMSGDNRQELEATLAYYSQDPKDSLKYKAACFLIENMPGHYTLAGEDVAYYRELIDNDTAGSYFSGKVLDISLPFYVQDITSEKQEDIMHVSSEFLINHIDATFDQLNRYPWLRNFPNDMFLEYLLPYRIMQERLDLWRDYLPIDEELLRRLHSADDIKYLPSRVAKHLNKFTAYKFHTLALQEAVFGMSVKMDCYCRCIQELLECRKNGIPATIDFIPAYGNRNGYHYWVTYISPEVKVPDVRYTTERKVPKIYRFTYVKHKNPRNDVSEYLPELFRNPFILDVTSLYTNTQDIAINNIRPLSSSPEYAYLCVFNNLDWQPVAIGKYNRKRIEFEQMGKDMVYLPIAYSGEQPMPLNYPFIVYRDGKTEALIPDTTARQKLLLTRKYPCSWQINELVNEIDKGCWVASNTPDFDQVDTVFMYSVCGNDIKMRHKQNARSSYRYWKYQFTGKYPRIAEFMFFSDDRQLAGFQCDQACGELFDKDPLTFTTLIHDLVVDIGCEMPITKIICIPRADGNFIMPGNEYELLYYDLDGWQSLGCRLPKDCWLEYDNIPFNTLLWLRNHTTGIEERIFTIENRTIRFW